jgi:hypothetical protein
MQCPNCNCNACTHSSRQDNSQHSLSMNTRHPKPARTPVRTDSRLSDWQRVALPIISVSSGCIQYAPCALNQTSVTHSPVTYARHCATVPSCMSRCPNLRGAVVTGRRQPAANTCHPHGHFWPHLPQHSVARGHVCRSWIPRPRARHFGRAAGA